MSDIVTAAHAAQAALDAAAGGSAVAVAVAARDGAPVTRMIVHEHGDVAGSLGNAVLDEAGERSARAALRARETEPRIEAVTIGDNTWQVYVETHRAPDHLIIVGAGHIAVPLAHLGVLIGMRVTVLDDREEMASPERFDEDVRVQRADFAVDPFAGVAIGPDSYVALVTRGHRWDFDCLHRIVASDSRPRYLGMIGSRRRVRAAFHALLESGIPREVLATIRAPIGLELHAETPAEIAVAIVAEMIAVRRGSDIGSISSRERVLDRFLGEVTS
ncbi:MAG TPA: XdhC family protein [Longimicrobiales bacterium]|nr:XdhC family protein [Longimicrobiales bacterium]